MLANHFEASDPNVIPPKQVKLNIDRMIDANRFQRQQTRGWEQ